MKCCFLGNEGWMWGRLWQLICRFFRTFCGAVLKLGLLSDIFFCFSIPSLTVGLVGNLLHAICVLCMFGRWAMSAVDYLGMVVGHWQWPISICCIYFFWREAINPPVTPDGYRWYDFTRVQLDDKKWVFFDLFTGCRQRVINRNKAEAQTALSRQSPIPSSVATSQKWHQGVWLAIVTSCIL